MVEPGFDMFWADTIPKWKSDDQLVGVTLWAGNYFGVEKQNTPPINSWANDPENDCAVLHITIQPGGTLTLPPAKKGSKVNRSLFYIEGAADVMKVGGTTIPERVVIDVNADVDIELAMDSTATSAGEFLLLQGIPIDEPVVQHGPFVMNSRNEIQQAFTDYSRTQFGGWPWPRDDMIFPREKKRFALLNGAESNPPPAESSDGIKDEL